MLDKYTCVLLIYPLRFLTSSQSIDHSVVRITIATVIKLTSCSYDHTLPACIHAVPGPTKSDLSLVIKIIPSAQLDLSVNVTCVSHINLSSRPEIDVSLTMDIHLINPTRTLLGNTSFTVSQPSYA